MASTRRYLENRLRLQINEAKSSVTQPDKVHFLGFRFGTANSSPNVEVLISFFQWYNEEHRHSGIGLLTPAMVHFGRRVSTTLRHPAWEFSEFLARPLTLPAC